MKIKNIKIEDYYKLTNTTIYDVVFEFLEPVNSFKNSICDFDKLTFNQVSVFKKLINSPTFENLRFIYSELYNQWFDNGNVIEFMQSYKWMLNKLKEVLDREKKMLFSVPDPKLIQAGINTLDKYGVWNTYINLAEQFNLNPREIGNWRYLDVLLIQARNKDVKEIRTNLSKKK